MSLPNALFPEMVEVCSQAFCRAWRFIERDPLLSGYAPALLQAELARALLALSDDDRDPLRLANRAIARVRHKIVGHRLGLVSPARPAPRPPIPLASVRSARHATVWQPPA